MLPTLQAEEYCVLSLVDIYQQFGEPVPSTFRVDYEDGGN
jgi:hypothetical protein